MSRTVEFTEQLISCPSVTPDDAGCLDLIGARLAGVGFACERLDSGPESFRVFNLWAIHRSNKPGARTLVFAGHTDVVPAGPIDQWSSRPFTPVIRDGKLYGRGAADMKGSIAAMIVACEEFLAAHADSPFSIAFLLTSDEEGPAVDGTVKVCEALTARGECLDWCIVGEPTAAARTGDTIKNGRRGTMSGKLTVKGVQGHVAYPHLARNPIHLLAPALAELAAVEWDNGNRFFPPTSWQVSNIHAGTGAGNVIPGECLVDFNFRFCTESTPEHLQRRLTTILDRHGLEYAIQWTIGGLPFLTAPGDLVRNVQQAIREETGIDPELSTTGGTSDGRFIAQICAEVIELGPPNASIHKIDEHVGIEELETLKNIYGRVLARLTLPDGSPNLGQ
ncbi:MAG TPA: succinyl-diaminopimelate desuccinylase [Terriglobia bacterium]|jgi:succinyl-diaminopimelate desuccinylase